MVRAVLRREGFEVDEVDSGRQAIDFIRRKQYDAIILDIMMGRGSGYDVLEALKLDPPAENCVVVISATSQPNLDKIDNVHVKTKLRKPFNINELLAAVRECTGH